MPTLKAKFNVTLEFEGKNTRLNRGDTALNAAKQAAGLLSELINEKFQSRKGSLFLTVNDVKDLQVLTKKTLIRKAR